METEKKDVKRTSTTPFIRIPEKAKEIDEPKEEIKTIGDDANIKKIGGE